MPTLTPQAGGSVADLTVADLQETLAQVWLAYLDAQQPPYPADGIAEEVVTTAWMDAGLVVQATAHIRGAWNGTASVTVPVQLAAAIAERLFETPPLDLRAGVERADMALIDDALGEVVNIVAGSLKSLLPQPSTLSLPEVSFVAAAASPVQPLLLHHDAAGRDADGADDSDTDGHLRVVLVAADQPLQVDLLATREP
jgi:hypothetical protein